MRRLVSALALLLAAGLAAAGETTCELTPGLQVPVAQDLRTFNQTGVQCVWCSLATLAKYQGHATAAQKLTDRYKTQAGPGQVRSVLDGLGIRYQMQASGNKDPQLLRDACARRWGAAVGLRGVHMVNVLHYAGGQVGLLDNCDRTLTVRTMSEQAFLAQWDGWAVVLIPPAEEAP
jgi:ABC-type bacteriocin/lantibiotic exporter with double-glycine peptidase domain